MPGTPAASRTPAGRAPAASKLPRFQKARPPTIRTMLLQDDYDDLNPNGTLPDQLTVNEGKGGPVDARDVSPGKKRGPRSENGRPEGSSGTPSRKSIVGSGSKDGAPKSKLGQAETAPQKQTVKTPTAASASAYASPYGQRKEKPKEKPRGAKSETSPLSNTSPRSPTSPGTFSQKSNGTAYSEPERNRNEPERNRNATENGAAGPESAIKAQVAEALHVLDHLEAHADALGSPSAAYGASEKAFGASEKSFSASEKAFNTSGKASAAVERGHGASNKGFGASESVYGAFATNGAMQSGRGPRGEVRSARRGGAAAAYASRVKKKAEEKKQLGARKDHAVQVARGIMRKMYRKNVALEKENRVLKTELYGQRKRVGELDSPRGALQERDRMIAQLKELVGELQARLRRQEEASTRSRKHTANSAGDHGESYKKLRADYQRLLTTRIDAVKKRGGASEEITKMLSDMRERLLQETAERETETALFNARLYKTEQQNADWYVEKKLLEQHIMKLEGELLERDQIDQQIEACIGSLFERMQILERTNLELNDMAAHYSQVAEATSPTASAAAAATAPG